MDNVDTTTSLALQSNEPNNENKDASNVITSSASNDCIVAVAKNRAELLIIGDDDYSNGSKSSLQSSFLKFRDQKMKERQLMKACRGVGTTRTTEFKDSLRAKFIETAKRYIGVPYGVKYKKEEDPVAPLYLDCCGLVRQVLLDLQDDFGFVIGKWNQAYQLDTLPGVLSEEELRPGDLVFYEGKYVSERSKKQKHNSVHVEIFLGGETGESTIGSRYHRGQVSIFPSYKFTSTTWTLVQHHFRSIDTWLDGVLRSHCEEHAWQSDALSYVDAAVGKRSIFCSAEEEEQQQQGEEEEEDEDCAGGDDEPELNFLTCSVTSSSSSSSSHLDISSIDGSRLPAADGLPPIATAAANKVDSKVKSKRPKRNSAFRNMLSSADTTTTTTTSSSSLSSSLEISPAKKSARAGRAVAAAAVVNNTLSKSLSSSIEFNCAKSTNKEGPKTFYVAKANGWKLVRNALEKRGWQMMPNEYHFSTKFGLKWVEARSHIDYLAHLPGQLVNHIPNNNCITHKSGLLATMRAKYCRNSSSSFDGSTRNMHPPWLPQTFDLESPLDRIALIQEEERLSSVASSGKTRKSNLPSTLPLKTPHGRASNHADAMEMPDVPLQHAAVEGEYDGDEDAAGSSSNEIKGGIWIYKPSNANRGRGIHMVAGIDALRELCHGEPMGGGHHSSSSSSGEGNTNTTSTTTTTSLPFKGIVQKYIKRPLLVMEEGYKFDIRVYLLISRNYPTTLAFYHPGYCRLSLRPYSIATLASLEDNAIHLTNAAIQKQTSTYKEEGNKEMQIQTVSAIADNLESLGKTDSAEYMRSELDSQIKLCMVDVMKACNHILLKKQGYFDLLGCDFMLSESNKLSLIEINTNPSLTLDNGTLKAMLPDIVDGAIELVLLSQGPDRRPNDSDDFLKNNSCSSSGIPASWSLVYDEGTGYCYKPKRKSKMK